MDRDHASLLRKKLTDLRGERHRLEEDLLGARRMIRGSLLAQSRLAGGKLRTTPAVYLYVPRSHARNRSQYIRQGDLEAVRRDVEAYRHYRQGLRRLRTLGREIVEALEDLGRCVEVPHG